MNSIRLRLLLTLLSLFIVAWSGTAALTWWKTSHEAEEVYDAHLARAGHILMGLALHEEEEWRKEMNDRPTEADLRQEVKELERLFFAQEYAAAVEFQVWQSGRLALHSSGSPHLPMSDGEGFSDRELGGAQWRVYTLPSEGGELMVQVAERREVRGAMIAEIVRQVLWPMAVALPLLAAAIWGGVGRALRPLRRLAEGVERRSHTQLEPIGDGPRTPEEVRPLVAAIDDLLVRLNRAFARERRFTADASHELRTPLAGIKAQAQVALRADADAEIRRRSIGQIIAGVDRTTHLVEQLLTLARLDPDQGLGERVEVDLRTVAAETVALCAPAALEKGVELELERDGPAPLTGNPSTLAALMRNLIDNAVRYTPAGGRVEASLRREEGRLIFAVADSGPGIPAEQRERVFERFHRGLGHDVEGCGLGLSIVQRVAQLHGAEVRLDDAPNGGLLAEVRFSK